MITGIGVDIVRTNRFVRWVSETSGEKFVERFFHADELSAIGVGADSNINSSNAIKSPEKRAESLAGKFAAKEAFSKALGSGFQGLNLKDICVCANESGKPIIETYGTAESLLNKNGADTIHVSVSHDGGFATAFVVLEKQRA